MMIGNYPKTHSETMIWELCEGEDPEDFGGCIGYYAHGLWEAESFIAAIIKQFDLEPEDPIEFQVQGVCYGVGELDEEEVFWVPSRRPEDANLDPLKAEFPVTFYLIPL